jgi:carbon storage regulator
MLIVTRRIGEEILINKGKIQIKFLYVRNNHIAVSIEAPPYIDIERKELSTRKKANPQINATQEDVKETK